jgi:hypothetical protein
MNTDRKRQGRWKEPKGNPPEPFQISMPPFHSETFLTHFENAEKLTVRFSEELDGSGF